jgi:hypothetical protein
MIDKTIQPTEGHFKIEQLDKSGNVIDTFEDKNMIMKQSRRTVAHSTAGHTAYDTYINKFVLGTKGHVQGNILEPRDFDYDIDYLFSQTENGYFYPITFDPLTINASTGKLNVLDEGYDSNDTPTVNSDIYMHLLDNQSTIEYRIEIPLDNANGSNGITAYTEAGLFTKEEEDLTDNPKKLGRIFAMRTFPAKIKEDAVTFRITWKIIF